MGDSLGWRQSFAVRSPSTRTSRREITMCGCLFEQTGFNEVRSIGIKRESLVKTPCVSGFGALLELY